MLLISVLSVVYRNSIEMIHLLAHFRFLTNGFKVQPPPLSFRATLKVQFGSLPESFVCCFNAISCCCVVVVIVAVVVFSCVSLPLLLSWSRV